jgi:putative tricarboxylic transport membrane protein
MNKWYNREFLLGVFIIFFAFAGVIFFIPFGIVVPDNSPQALAPNFWPLIVMYLVGFSGAAISAHGLADFLNLRDGASSSIFSNSSISNLNSDNFSFFEAMGRATIVIIAFFVFYLIIPFIGIVLSSSIMLVFLIYFGGDCRWQIILPIAFLLPLFLYLFFVHVANVPMPLGFFEAFQ